ncbi:hypothetical protein SRHO_G00012980 [Serrasalmus rhombeus]
MSLFGAPYRTGGRESLPQSSLGGQGNRPRVGKGRKMNDRKSTASPSVSRGVLEPIPAVIGRKAGYTPDREAYSR